MFSPLFYQLKGELIIALSPNRTFEAETMFEQAYKVAQLRQLPMPELRAAIHLYRLWQPKPLTATNPTPTQENLPKDLEKARQGRQILSNTHEKWPIEIASSLGEVIFFGEQIP